MSFPAYRECKDSGVKWLGDLPSHWGVKKIGHLADLITGFAFPSEGFSFDDSDLTIPLVRGESVSEGYLRWGERGRYWPKESPYEERYLLNVDDIVVQMDGSKVGKNWAIVTEKDLPLLLVQRVTRIRCREANPKFVFSLIANEMFVRYVDQAKTDPAVPHITMRNISDYWIPVPPPDEQKAISSFLDVETSKIDRLVSEQRRLIELLKEKRQAVISHAVTKGVNPNAPMKPSGIQWLGDVPQHWEVKPVRYACDIDNTLRTPIDKQTRSDIEGDYPYYGPTGILSWINKFVVEGQYFLLGEDGDHFLKFQTQPMIVNVGGRFNVNNHAHLIKGKGNCSTKWASLYFEHKDLMPWLIKQGVGRYKLRKEKLLTIPIIVPPPIEQGEILVEANRVKATTTALVVEAERAIELLQERRTALISAAVTGKIDVREFVCQETA